MRAGRNPTSIWMPPGTYWYVLKHVRRRCAPQLGLVSVCACAAFKRAAASAAARPAATDRLRQLHNCSVCATDVQLPPVRRLDRPSRRSYLLPATSVLALLAVLLSLPPDAPSPPPPPRCQSPISCWSSVGPHHAVRRH